MRSERNAHSCPGRCHCVGRSRLQTAARVPHPLRSLLRIGPPRCAAGGWLLRWRDADPPPRFRVSAGRERGAEAGVQAPFFAGWRSFASQVSPGRCLSTGLARGGRPPSCARSLRALIQQLPEVRGAVAPRRCCDFTDKNDNWPTKPVCLVACACGWERAPRPGGALPAARGCSCVTSAPLARLCVVSCRYCAPRSLSSSSRRSRT